MPLLSVRDLRVTFPAEQADFAAVDGLDFSIERGEVFALVGESGCGKSLTALALMGLLPSAATRSLSSFVFDGRDLLGATREDLRKIRGKRMAMVFQEPMTSLNPVFTVGSQIAEMLTEHEGLGRGEALTQAVGLLGSVHIPAPRRCVSSYPHQLSGGMRQRVMIAMAISCNPALLIADEPTTALDVTIQAQILDLLRELRGTKDLSLLFISHDLGVVAQIADRVMVMYAGVAMEEAPVGNLFGAPRHPYTRGLLASLPHEKSRRLRPVDGVVPGPGQTPVGCRFAPRCPHARDVCRVREPEWRRFGPGGFDGGRHMVRCVRAEDL